MAEEANVTQGEEVKSPAEVVEAPTAPAVEEAKPQTISDMLGDEAEKPKKPETVGLDKFLAEKKARKALEGEIKELKTLIETGGTKEEVSDSLDELSKEYPDVDPKFLQKLVKTIKADAEKGVDEKISSKLRPIEEKERKAKLETVFKKGFTEALDTMPEFQKVVNEDVIFKLSLLPENGSKTFAQLIEETYSNAIGGKRTYQTTTPGGGKEPEPLDVARASRDTAYFLEIMANPKLKAEYNKQMLYKGF
jgi:hypothetical protein